MATAIGAAILLAVIALSIIAGGRLIDMIFTVAGSVLMLLAALWFFAIIANGIGIAVLRVLT